MTSPPASRAAAMAGSILVIHVLGRRACISDHRPAIGLDILGKAVLIIPVAIVVSGAIWSGAALRAAVRVRAGDRSE